MYLNFVEQYLPQKKIDRKRAVSLNSSSVSSSSNKGVNSPVIYNMCSVHFDRVNIVKRIENRGKSKGQIIKESDSEVIFKPVVPKIIKYSVDNKLSNQTQQKISKSIKYLNFISGQKKVVSQDKSFQINFKLAFVTLTLSSIQIHPDNIIKNQLLNQLFVELKNKYHVVNYVWRCEKQSNGNVHFHILLDKFIPHAELRLIWNRLQEKLGYVSRYAESMSKLSYKEYQALRNKYKKTDENIIRNAWKVGKSTKWQFPNSTDVHSLQYITSIDAYLIKYMSKSAQNKNIEGRLWGCSQSLSNLTGGRDIVDSALSSELNRLITDSEVKNYKGEYFQVLYFNYFTLERLGCVLLMKLLREWLIKKFDIIQDS